MRTNDNNIELQIMNTPHLSHHNHHHRHPYDKKQHSSSDLRERTMKRDEEGKE